jgi:hypothetical protein
MDKEADKNYFVGISSHRSYHRFQTWTLGTGLSRRPGFAVEELKPDGRRGSLVTPLDPKIPPFCNNTSRVPSIRFFFVSLSNNDFSPEVSLQDVEHYLEISLQTEPGHRTVSLGSEGVPLLPELRYPHLALLI